MAVEMICRITCDECGKRTEGPVLSLDQVRQVGVEAGWNGWTHIDGADFCPGCISSAAKQREKIRMISTTLKQSFKVIKR